MDNNDKYIGMVLEDRYEIIELIGSGGMANVYKALCNRLNRYDAVKIMHEDMAANEEFRKRFIAESKAVAMLSHPNIVSVYDVSHSDELEYIVMELIEGSTLKEYMSEHGALPASEVESFAAQIARALAHAHDKGIIHRDIKPQNIMLLANGLIKVADFGIASLQSEVEAPSDEALGSVHYIAPEQARGNAPDNRSDIYSLGIVMYEMLTGRLPFSGSSAVEIAVKHMNESPAAPTELNASIPPELERITLKAMAADIEERYQSAEELLSDLEVYHNEVIATMVQLESDDSAEAKSADGSDIAGAAIVSSQRLVREAEDVKGERRRAKKVAFNTGVLGALAVAVLLLIFLNIYLFQWLFSDPVRIDVTNFVGKQAEIVTNDPEYKKTYSFTIREFADTEGLYEEGEIVGQDPAAGKSVNAEELVSIELSVATRKDATAVAEDVPDVQNMSEASAIMTLEKAGFECSVTEAPSSGVTRGYVISTDPAGGESAVAGSTVSIVVSSGPEKEIVSVPQLVGLDKDSATAKIESSKLSLASVTIVDSEYDAGTVVWQSLEAGTDAEAYTKIYIQVSNGGG